MTFDADRRLGDGMARVYAGLDYVVNRYALLPKWRDSPSVTHSQRGGGPNLVDSANDRGGQ